MFFIRRHIKDRLWMFGISVLVAAFLLAICQSVIYVARLDAESRQIDRITAIQTAEWNTIEVIIKDTIYKAGVKLDEEVIPSVVSAIDKSYGENIDRLTYDLQNFSNVEYDNPLIHILAGQIQGKYMYDIKSDSNDIFVMTKKDGVITDPSLASSSPDRPRSLEMEAQSHYNANLARQAFYAIINQSRKAVDPIIFWQFFNPTLTTQEQIEIMSLSNLKTVFEKNNGNLASLESYEFLVPRYIFFDRDLLGNQLVDDRGRRQDIHQLILVQGFNVYEIIQKSGLLESIYSGINENRKLSITEFVSVSRMQQILLFIGFFSIILLVQFATRARRKYVDDNSTPMN